MWPPFLFIATALAAGHRGEHGRDVAEWTRGMHHHDDAPRSIALTRKDYLLAAKKNFPPEAEEGDLLSRAKGALKELLDYYQGDEAMLSLAKRGATPATERLGGRLARKLKRGEVITIACVGSSVTAGHDGFGSTAWPAVLERRLKNVGNIRVLNQAVGGQKPYPASFCLPAVCGNVDAVFREWEYWTLDDGVDPFRRDTGRFGPVQAAQHFAARVADLADDFDGTAGFIQLDVSGRKEHKTKMLVETLGSPSFLNEDISAAVFSSFGVAFDHLRAKTSSDRYDRQGRAKCSGPNVGECPLAPFADGYHAKAEKEGVDPLPPTAKKPQLFINWHPGSLGHEVVGNQIAYFLLSRLVKALEEEEEDRALSPPPPTRKNPVAETPYPLSAGKVKCATSTLPAAVGPSVGDLVDNTTAATQWIDEPTPSALRTQEQCSRPCKGSDTQCYDSLRKCSYRDQKRGFKGGPQDGPLSLKIPFSPTDKCIAYLVEPGFEWNKPLIMANWAAELKISVDGTPCGTACTVSQGKGEYMQAMRIDVRAHRGSCGPARIDARIEPLSSLGDWEKNSSTPVCAVAKNGRCEPSGIWKRYDLRCTRDSQYGSGCAFVSAHRPSKVIRTYVDSVLYF